MAHKLLAQAGFEFFFFLSFCLSLLNSWDYKPVSPGPTRSSAFKDEIIWPLNQEFWAPWKVYDGETGH